MQWVVVVLLALAGLLRAVHDSLTHSPDRGRLSAWANTLPDKWLLWIHPRVSWRNKYRNGDSAKGPKFPGSTTWLVGFTDLWHLSNMASWACADAAFLLAAWPRFGWWAAAGVAARRFIFQPVYSFLRHESQA